MEFLKKVWPSPFKVEPKNVGSLVVKLIVFFLVCVVASVLIAIVGKLPIGIIKWVAGIIGGLVDAYCLVGIVLGILKFADVLKD